MATTTKKIEGWTEIESQLSPSYWICDANNSVHVYRRGRKWIRVRVIRGLCHDAGEYKTRHEAMEAE